ncbi:MAG: substrate-binding domain-containing protein [Desulfovibrionaceae bacterium]|nr:substrate-binding domain-containing protein [Desulfovibrionaceae bacterium]
MEELGKSRRVFMGNLLAGGAALTLGSTSLAKAESKAPTTLRVWSCGGLAEAMHPAHQAYKTVSGVEVAYTGAFAGALGKSLLDGKGETEVFAGRVLALAKNLRKAGKMIYFKPLCFTSYVIVTPRGNPKSIKTLEDLGKKGMRVAMAPKASPPGSQSVVGILKKSGLTEAVMKNVLDKDASCIQRTITEVTTGHADAMIVERRLTTDPRYKDYLDVVEIPEEFFPEGPLTFTVGVMQTARDRGVADAYVEWITGSEGQEFFAKVGFIPAISPKGQELVEKLGVHDD